MKRMLCLLLIAVLTLTATACAPQTEVRPTEAEPVGHLSVHFIDVGQGDSTLLESDGEFVLIDAGEYEYGAAVRDFILSCGAERIKYMIATHPHSDHIGGLRTVMDGIETENFITKETDCDTFGWTKTLKKVEMLGINYIDAIPGNRYEFGSAAFTILGPLSDGYEGYNSYSVVVKAECGEISFLLTGDAEQDAEYEMLDAGEDLTADVLKCGHHGSSTSNSTRFLQAVDPAYAVASCGKNNDYGHPHKEVRERLGLLGTELLRTDEQGTITASTDGRTVSFTANGKGIGAYTAGQTPTDPSALYFVGNRSSMIFHDPTCEGGQSMKEKNRVVLQTYEDAVGGGYKPCPYCHP